MQEAKEDLHPWTSSRKRFVFWLDVALFAGFLFLLSPRLTGLAVHEVLGMAFSLILLVHLLIAWPWISAVAKRVFASADRGMRVSYLLNGLLFVLVIIELVSGLAISQVVLPFAGVNTINDGSWRALHNQTLNWTMLVVGLHIAMNWRWVLSALHMPRISPDGIKKNPLRLSPDWASGLRRILVLLFAAGCVGGLAFAALGKPSPERIYIQDEIARFGPTAGHGLGQLAGESFLLALVVYVGYRWLRMRL